MFYLLSKKGGFRVLIPKLKKLKRIQSPPYSKEDLTKVREWWQALGKLGQERAIEDNGLSTFSKLSEEQICEMYFKVHLSEG